MSSGQTLIGTTPLAIPSLGEFEARRQHAYNKIAYDLPVKRGRFLDIGCGMGNALVAALQAGFSLAVGVDRSLSEFAHTMPLPFDEICAKYNLVAEQALLVEGDIFAFGFQPGSLEMFNKSADGHCPE